VTSRRLVVDAAVRDDLFERARAGAAGDPPVEVCGVLDGERGDPDRVRRAHPVENVAADPRTRYELDPEATLATLAAVEDRGFDVVGFYHSHPEGSAAPSAVDREAAAWPDRVHVIVGLGGDGPELRAWRDTGEAFAELRVEWEP
jgi:proteasome lid subunit RPN8/RPN11